MLTTNFTRKVERDIYRPISTERKSTFQISNTTYCVSYVKSCKSLVYISEFDNKPALIFFCVSIICFFLLQYFVEQCSVLNIILTISDEEPKMSPISPVLFYTLHHQLFVEILQGEAQYYHRIRIIQRQNRGLQLTKNPKLYFNIQMQQLQHIPLQNIRLIYKSTEQLFTDRLVLLLIRSGQVENEYQAKYDDLKPYSDMPTTFWHER